MAAKREKPPAIFKKDRGLYVRFQYREQGVKVRRAWKVGTVGEPLAVVERTAKVVRAMVKDGKADEVDAYLAGKVQAPQLSAGHDITVHEVAMECLEREERDNARAAQRARAVYVNHVQKQIGRLPVAAVTPATILERVYEVAAEKGMAPASVRHIRNVCRKVFKYALFRELIPSNPCDKVWKMPKCKKDERQFVLLTDQEFWALVTFLLARPPDENTGGVTALELVTAVVVARFLAGMRTSDLKVWLWTDIDLVDWAYCTVRRPKTERDEHGDLIQSVQRARHVINEEERAVLKRWWEHQGCPTSGLVFPVRTGERAGKVKKGTYYAKPLKVAMRRAFGIDVPRTVTKTVIRKYASGKTRPMSYETTVWEQVRELTPREVTVILGDDQFRPFNFHSLRRAYATGLAIAGWSRAQMRTAGGWASDAMPARYDQSVQQLVVDAAGTTPKLKLVKTG